MTATKSPSVGPVHTKLQPVRRHPTIAKLTYAGGREHIYPYSSLLEHHGAPYRMGDARIRHGSSATRKPTSSTAVTDFLSSDHRQGAVAGWFTKVLQLDRYRTELGRPPPTWLRNCLRPCVKDSLFGLMSYHLCLPFPSNFLWDCFWREMIVKNKSKNKINNVLQRINPY